MELGANDYMKSIPPAQVQKNLSFIIDQVQSKNPKVKILLAGLQAFSQIPYNPHINLKDYEQVYKDFTKKI